ncbi:inhibitor of growth proteins N-terminal histone-binding-domain-containing protein [Schizophyllum fasciatum]
MSFFNPNSQDIEQASNITADFIYAGLENLPKEVRHILAEIQHRETRATDLQRDIEKEYAKYLKLTLRPPQGDSSAKAAALVPKIMGHYAEVHRLCDEKCALAQRLADLLDSKRRHLDADLALVRRLAGEEAEPPAAAFAVKREPDAGGLSGANAAQQISDSIRSAMAGTPVADAALPGEAVAVSVSHKRRKTATRAEHKRSASPAASATPPPQRSRARKSQLAQEIEEPPVPEPVEMEVDEAEAEDDKLYCFCRQPSHGEVNDWLRQRRGLSLRMVPYDLYRVEDGAKDVVLS